MTATKLSSDLPVADLANRLFAARKDPARFSPAPFSPPQSSGYPSVPLVDYSEAGLRIELGLRNLDESIPNGESLRTEEAFRALRRGVHDLEIWLAMKGLDVRAL